MVVLEESVASVELLSIFGMCLVLGEVEEIVLDLVAGRIAAIESLEEFAVLIGPIYGQGGRPVLEE